MVERGTLAGQRTVATRWRNRGAGRGRGDPPAGDHGGRRGGRAARDARVARARARCTARWSRSRARRAQASGLAARLRELGAEVVETPAIRIEPRPVEGELPRRSTGSAIRAGLPHQPERGAPLLRRAAADRDARTLAGATVAAIGPGTAAALLEHGIEADVVPEHFVAEALRGGARPLELGRQARLGRPRRGGARRAARLVARARR